MFVSCVHVELDHHTAAAPRCARALGQVDEGAAEPNAARVVFDVQLVEELLAAALGAADGKGHSSWLSAEVSVCTVRSHAPRKVLLESVAVAWLRSNSLMFWTSRSMICCCSAVGTHAQTRRRSLAAAAALALALRPQCGLLRQLYTAHHIELFG